MGSTSTPANIRRRGDDAVVDGNAVKWDEATNQLVDAGELDEVTILTTSAQMAHWETTASSGLTFAPPAPLTGWIFDEGMVQVKVVDVSDSNKLKVKIPLEINPSTGAVTLADADVDSGDTVHVTWFAIVD